MRQSSPFLKRPDRLPDLALESSFWNQNKKLIAGVDEVGRGCIAGPVTAAAVVLMEPLVDLDQKHPFSEDPIADSKCLKASIREKLSEKIKTEALAYGICSLDAATVDRLNIFHASLAAMQGALLKLQENLSSRSFSDLNCALIDGNQTIRNPGPAFKNMQQVCVVKGDQISLSIAAASILAKVERDRMMKEVHCDYPAYQFESNKGYGSAKHISALKELGPTPFHRKSFAPVKRVLGIID